MAAADDRSVARLPAQLTDARDQLAAAEQFRDRAEPGSADYLRWVRVASRSWMRVRRLERELEAVRLANARH